MEEIDQLAEKHLAELDLIFNEKHKKLIATTGVFKQTLEACEAKGFNTHAKLWNIGIYINIAAHDLSVLVKQLHFERDEWTRKQIARHIVLTIYEVTEDMTQLLGKKIREPLQTLGLLSRFDPDLRKARLPLDSFWKQHQAKLSGIRCMSAAHRDLDGRALLESIEAINIMEVAELGLEVGRILNRIGSVIQAILNESSNIPPPKPDATS